MQRLLAAGGYQTVSFGTAEAATEDLRTHEASLIIIESSASRLIDSSIHPSNDDSGESLRRLHWAQLALNFCEEIRACDATTDVPILMISKSHRAQDKVACLNQGATDYITRPYQRAELLSRVRAHLRSSRYERERGSEGRLLRREVAPEAGCTSWCDRPTGSGGGRGKSRPQLKRVRRSAS